MITIFKSKTGSHLDDDSRISIIQFGVMLKPMAVQFIGIFTDSDYEALSLDAGTAANITKLGCVTIFIRFKFRFQESLDWTTKES